MKPKVKKISYKNKKRFLDASNFRNYDRCNREQRIRLSCCFSFCCRHNYSVVIFMIIIFLLNLANIALCNSNIDTNDRESESKSESNRKYANESLIEARELFEQSTDMVWSQLLEDYVLSQSPGSRTSKDFQFMSNMVHDISAPSGYGGNGPAMPMMNPQASLNYHSSAYKRPTVYITKRIGESAVELEPHMRPPIVNPQFRPMTNQMVNQEQRQQPGFLQQLFGLAGSTTTQQQQPQQPQQQQQQQQHIQQLHRPIPPQQHHTIQSGNGAPPFRAVTENDLYLLGAIEKMVYRVDYLESRIRRAEQLIYYLMAGNNQKEVRDPCPTNFTRISDNCYYINSQQQVNWKTANSACKALSAHLAEFERVSENEELMAHILNQQQHRGRDYWLGGLNPGLLWIWSNSAKPVNPNMNLTSIAMSHDQNGNSTESNIIDHKKENDGKSDSPNDETILNNTLEIKGQGRCLRLTYNEAKHSYSYYGQECTSRHHYICEYEDKTLDNKIKKITRELKLFD